MGIEVKRASDKGQAARNEEWNRSSVSTPAPPSPDTLVRLQKVIADSGLTSRRKAEEMIRQGRVAVNGRVVQELGKKVDPTRDHVKVDGRHLKPTPPQVFVLLNKPKGYLSSLNDPAGRPTVRDLLAGVRLRVFPVGRLDFDGEGLLLLTNHGEMAQALLHPRFHVPKTYLVKVKGVLENDEIESLTEGIELEDGRTAPAAVRKIAKARHNSWLEITIHEGRKHQVKRMFETVGHPVLRLKRVRFGPLTLGDLQPGKYRYLTDQETKALRAFVQKRRGADKGSQGSAIRGKRNGKGRPHRSREFSARRSRLTAHPASGAAL